jgi:Protein of unknown function (DUF4254)
MMRQTVLLRALGEANLHGLAARTGACEALAELRSAHERLWDLEDCARSTSAGDAEIARVKRAIDRENALRHRLIDAADCALGASDARHRPAAQRSYSETIGELCDRLLILDLKIANLQQLALDPELPRADSARCRDRQLHQSKWRLHLQQCLAQQLADHHSGRALLAPRAEFKLYNDPLLNPITRREGAGDGLRKLGSCAELAEGRPKTEFPKSVP